MMSLALLFHYLMLNMFRMLVHPPSGALNNEIIKLVTSSWSIFILKKHFIAAGCYNDKFQRKVWPRAGPTESGFGSPIKGGLAKNFTKSED